MHFLCYNILQPKSKVHSFIRALKISIFKVVNIIFPFSFKGLGIETAVIEEADIVGTNGILHVIDEVLVIA